MGMADKARQVWHDAVEHAVHPERDKREADLRSERGPHAERRREQQREENERIRDGHRGVGDNLH